MQKISVVEDEAGDTHAVTLEELDGAAHIAFAQPIAKVQGKRARKRKGRKERRRRHKSDHYCNTCEGDHEGERLETNALLDAKGWRQTPLLEPNRRFNPFLR